MKMVKLKVSHTTEGIWVARCDGVYENKSIDVIFRLDSQRRDEEEVKLEDEAEKTPEPELYGLGDRLNVKLTEEKKALAAKLSNYSCILQELNVVDKVPGVNVIKL
jgi:hypothetical protein